MLAVHPLKGVGLPSPGDVCLILVTFENCMSSSCWVFWAVLEQVPAQRNILLSLISSGMLGVLSSSLFPDHVSPGCWRRAQMWTQGTGLAGQLSWWQPSAGTPGMCISHRGDSVQPFPEVMLSSVESSHKVWDVFWSLTPASLSLSLCPVCGVTDQGGLLPSPTDMTAELMVPFHSSSQVLAMDEPVPVGCHCGGYPTSQNCFCKSCPIPSH